MDPDLIAEMKHYADRSGSGAYDAHRQQEARKLK